MRNNFLNQLHSTLFIFSLPIFLSHSVFILMFRDVDLVVVFDCLNTGNDQQIEVACEVIKYLLAFVDPEIVLQKYGELMRVGLDHRNCQVTIHL